MALITGNSRMLRTLMFSVLVGVITLGGINAFASGNNADQRRAKTLQAEQVLADLGYWVISVDGASDDSTRQAIMAFQKVEGLKRTGVLTDDVLNAIQNASRPVAKYSDGASHVEIDISRQVIFLVDEAGQVTKVLSTSTGSGERYFSQGKWERALTPRGKFVISRQIHGIRKAPLGTIYNPSYFNGGIAIHGSPSVPASAASHGCARIPRFADKDFVDMVSIGMTVYVYD
jgi:lipoprotein-anchoring transpeptidase ErfK/SrfK